MGIPSGRPQTGSTATSDRASIYTGRQLGRPGNPTDSAQPTSAGPSAPSSLGSTGTEEAIPFAPERTRTIRFPSAKSSSGARPSPQSSPRADAAGRSPVRAADRYGVSIPRPDKSSTTRGTKGIPSESARPSPGTIRPTSPERSYGAGPRGRGNLGTRSGTQSPSKALDLVRPSAASPLRPSSSSVDKPRPGAAPGGRSSTTALSLGRGAGLRGSTSPRPSYTRPSDYRGTGGSSSSYGSSALRPSNYWGGYLSYGYAPHYSIYTPYYFNYLHCSPWSFGYYGSHFGFKFGGWFYPYGFYYRSYRGYGHSYWSPIDYSYCLPSYYSIVYVTQTYDTGPSDSLPPEQATQPAAAAPALLTTSASKPLDAAADRYIQLGDEAFGEGRYSDAVQLYAKAVEFAPEEASLYLVLSDALFASGDYHYAAYVIRKALELDPLLTNTQVDKHDFYANPAILDQQLAVLESYLIRHPIDRDARLVLALNYLFGARPAAAVDLLEAPQAANLAGDTAAELILQSARSIQHGAQAK